VKTINFNKLKTKKTMSKIIPIEQAIEMKKEYKTHINPLIENYRGLGYKASDFAWIDLQSLKDYIKLLDDVKTLNGKDISGVRIYFSAYPDKSTFDCNGAAVVEKGRETVFLVPTMQVNSSTDSTTYPNLENVPFCIKPDSVATPLKGELQVINDLLNSKDCTSGNGTNNYANKTSLVMDQMGLTPPPG
jgi:hypothetical protein